MSSLIFHVEPEQVLVVTDTLIVNAVESDRRWFSSKSIYLPHLRTIVAATGLADLYANWIGWIISDLQAHDLDSLSALAPEKLRIVAEEMKRTGRWPDSLTGTIYLFGYSAQEQCMRGHAFRSESGFQREVLEHGTGVKPPCAMPEEGDLLAQIPVMMEAQRIAEAAKPEAGRLYIGGEAIASHLTQTLCQTWLLHEFDDFDSIRRGLQVAE